MTPSLSEILLGRVIDADPIAAEDADGWPEPRSQQRAEQARAPIRLEGAPEDGCRLVGRELDGLHRRATVVFGQGRLASHPKVLHPAALAVRGLDKHATVEFDHADGHRARLAGPPTTYGQENIRGTSWHPRRNQPAYERVEQAEQPPTGTLPEIDSSSTLLAHALPFAQPATCGRVAPARSSWAAAGTRAAASTSKSSVPSTITA
jgi:hypothetical protein